jgi:pyruvate dehydrogenase E2 component (dihydrolipoamide acetyltransferase)
VARIDVLMPQMGESIAEGTLSKWLKKIGDPVKRDEPIFEISTDKVDAEIPAPNAGVLAEILVTEGQTVPVQTVVARIESDGAGAVAAGGTAASAQAPASPAPAPTRAEPASSAPSRGAAPSGSGGPPPSTESTADTAPRRHQSVAGPSATPRPPAAPGSFEERVRTRSSPLVRRIAAEHNIDLQGLTGSGIAGRVTKRDILAYLDAGGETAARAPGPSMYAPAGFDYQPPAVDAWPGDVVEPMSKIRRLTAGHMVFSKHTSAHVTTVFEIDLTRVSRVRDRLRGEFDARGEKLTYLPFVIQAVISGLQKYPVLNAAVRGSDIIYRKQYNIGIAVALDWGLIVPVIRNADDLSLAGLTRALNDLASRARAKKLRPEEVQDTTFSITNPGVFGSIMGTPVIPQPTVAILGTGTIEKRPKVVKSFDGDDVIAVRTCAHFFLSFDHRVVDGADADRFLGHVKEQLESIPETGF